MLPSLHSQHVNTFITSWDKLYFNRCFDNWLKFPRIILDAKSKTDDSTPNCPESIEWTKVTRWAPSTGPLPMHWLAGSDQLDPAGLKTVKCVAYASSLGGNPAKLFAECDSPTNNSKREWNNSKNILKDFLENKIIVIQLWLSTVLIFLEQIPNLWELDSKNPQWFG